MIKQRRLCLSTVSQRGRVRLPIPIYLPTSFAKGDIATYRPRPPAIKIRFVGGSQSRETDGAEIKARNIWRRERACGWGGRENANERLALAS